MSFTTVIFPIIAALLAPEGKFFPKDTVWFATNNKQKYFLENIYTPVAKRDLSYFSKKELRYWASNDHNELNNIAKSEGFNIELQPFMPAEFGTLSILDVILKWNKKGEDTKLEVDHKTYKAAKLKEGFIVFQTNYQHPIIQIQTQNNDNVYLTVADEPISDYEVLLEKIKFFKSCINAGNVESCDELIFPCVNLNQQVNISWLLGMQEMQYHVSQALQQTKFKMDTQGAHAQSAVLLSFIKVSAHIRDIKTVCIDKPFFVWIERNGVSLPIFAGYIDQRDWEIAN